MATVQLFVVFPYLKTSAPVNIRGITLRSSQDLSGLSSDAHDQLRSLFTMFFLRDNLHISRMSYTYFEDTGDALARRRFIEGVRQVRIVLGYFYGMPNSKEGDPFLYAEHSSAYLLSPDDRIFLGNSELDESLVEAVETREAPVNVRPANGATSLEKEQPGDQNDTAAREPSDGLATLATGPGFKGTLNGITYIEVPVGRRIYPPAANLWLNISQDLYLDLLRFEQSRPDQWALQRFMSTNSLQERDDLLRQVETRVFTALEWHNSNTALGISEAVALVHLAIAFESLLQLDVGDETAREKAGVVKRLNDAIRTLLGPIPRLDSWYEQFYRARSAIVHEGATRQLLFHAVPRGQVESVLSGKNPGREYRPLTAYGRHVFRLCLDTILTGTQLADEAGLAALFVHNQERLEKMCQILSQKGTSAQQRMRGVEATVRELEEHRAFFDEGIKLETVFTAGTLLVKAYLQTNPTLPGDIAGLMSALQLDPKDVEATFDKLVELLGRIRGWYAQLPSPRQQANDEWLDLVWAFLEYAIHITTDRKISQWQRRRASVSSEGAQSGSVASS